MLPNSFFYSHSVFIDIKNCYRLDSSTKNGSVKKWRINGKRKRVFLLWIFNSLNNSLARYQQQLNCRPQSSQKSCFFISDGEFKICFVLWLLQNGVCFCFVTKARKNCTDASKVWERVLFYVTIIKLYFCITELTLLFLKSYKRNWA